MELLTLGKAEKYSQTKGKVTLDLSWKEKKGSPGRQVQWDSGGEGSIPNRGEYQQRGNSISLIFGI